MSVLLCFAAALVFLYVILYYVVFRGTGFSNSVRLDGKTAIVTGSRHYKQVLTVFYNTHLTL